MFTTHIYHFCQSVKAGTAPLSPALSGVQEGRGGYNQLWQLAQ